MDSESKKQYKVEKYYKSCLRVFRPKKHTERHQLLNRGRFQGGNSITLFFSYDL